MKRFAYLNDAVLIAMLLTVFGCGKQKTVSEMTILIRMMPAQQRFFRQEIIAPFERENHCKINIATFNNQWDIERMLKLETGKKTAEIGLVKTPFEITHALVKKGFMKKLDEIVDSEQVMNDLAEYHQLASALGFIDGGPYYIPRKLETQIMFYRRSMVADAIAKFESYKKEIQSELKKYNSWGLPAGYVLEADPNAWDFYDLYVVGYVWSHEKYNDVVAGRLAHRGARYEGTALHLIDRALQLGATKEDLLKLTSDKVTDMFVWERALIRSGAFNPGMWQDPWKGSNIYNAIKDGKAFIAFLQQIDCFNVHGWEEDPGMPTYLPNINDMGLARIPQAVSFELDNKGKPLYEGTRVISTGGWWWGIPKTGPNAKLAYSLARYITNKENQADECSRFGMIPVRKDILNNLPQVFDQGWVGDIFKVSVDQIKLHIAQEELVTAPLVPQYAQVGQNYVEAWYALCVEYNEEKDGLMNFSTMKMRLASDFLDKQQEILGQDYPE